MDISQPTPAGHNRPPVECPKVDDIRADLVTRFPELATRRDELLATAKTIPSPIPEGDEETAKKVSDFLAMCRKFLKVVNGHREAEKAAYLAGGETVDGFFKAGLSNDVEAKGKTIRAAELVYIDNKAQAEKRHREEEARLAQVEANRKLQEAQEAERVRLKAIRDAEEKAIADAAEAERVRKLTANPNAEEPAPPPPVPPVETPSMAPVNTKLDEAITAQAHADQLARNAEAKPAAMGRVRGDLGGVSTIRKVWTGETSDRAQLDLESLRQHFTEDALNAAVRAFVKANTGAGLPSPVLKGANIFQRNV